MAALTVDLETAKPLADKHFCGIAGLNLPDQTVVGGSSADLDALSDEMAELHPKKRAVRLKTEGAFHTYFMVGAARHFRDELNRVQIGTPSLKVLSNYTGGFHEDDGETTDYEKGKYAITRFSLQDDKFTIHPATGDLSVIAAERTYRIHVHGLGDSELSFEPFTLTPGESCTLEIPLTKKEAK